MLKVKVRWQGFTGSPGWSNFYFDDATGDLLSNAEAVTCVERVKQFFTAVRPYFPDHVQWAIQPDVEQIHATSGKLFGVENTPQNPVIAGTALDSAYSAATGVVVTWRTAGVRNGRRVRGRTFLVPAAYASYQDDGSLSAACITAINTASTALADQAGNIPLGVWSRPSGPGLEDGDWFPVNGISVPDMAAVLRSRRN